LIIILYQMYKTLIFSRTWVQRSMLGIDGQISCELDSSWTTGII